MDKNYSEAALVAFLDYVGEKGIIKEATAKSRKVAATKVLGALDEHEKLDLRQIDREAAFQRFENKNASDFTPGSLTTYRSRFNSAIDDFLLYMENRSGFKPASAARASRKSKGASGKPGSESTARQSAQPVIDPQKALDEVAFPEGPSKITVPIPVRPGVVVLVSGLPSDLSPSEANRIAGVITAFAIPTEKNG